MKEMGWDWRMYLDQPDDFVRLVEAIVIGQKRAEIKESKKYGKGQRT